MSAKSVTIVGVGALGSHVAMLLRNEADIRVIDFDKVETKNTSAQFFGKPGVGKLKSQALSQTMQLLWGTKLDVITSKLTQSNVNELLSWRGGGLILDCLDNGEARRLVQNYARGTSTPCLHGALAANGEFGRVIWDADFVIDDTVAGAPTCEGGEHLPMISVVSSYIAMAAQTFLRTGVKRGISIAPWRTVVV